VANPPITPQEVDILEDLPIDLIADSKTQTSAEPLNAGALSEQNQTPEQNFDANEVGIDFLEIPENLNTETQHFSTQTFVSNEALKPSEN